MKGRLGADGWNDRTIIQDNTSEQRERARIAVASFAQNTTDLTLLLAILGLGLTAEEWILWQERQGWLAHHDAERDDGDTTRNGQPARADNSVNGDRKIHGR